MDVGAQLYRGFISYSQRDRRFAKRLHRALEAYRAPDGVQSPKIDAETGRIGAFFRDDDELAAESDLSDALDKKIDGSEHLIVLCSPHSAQSKWVDKEVRRFKRRGEGRVFAVIVRGTPHALDPKDECLCPALKVKVDSKGELTSEAEEPLAPHWRKEGLKRLTAKLAAGLIGVGFDNLWRRQQRHARARLRNRLVVAGSILTAVASILVSNLRLQAIERSSTLSLLSAKALDQSLTGGQNEESSDRALRFGVVSSRGWWLEPASELAEPSLARAAFMSSGIWATKVTEGIVRARLFDGAKRLALLSEEGGVEVLDVATGAAVHVDAPKGKVIDIAAGAQGRLTLAVLEAGAVRAWTLTPEGLERGRVISEQLDANVTLTTDGERALVFDSAGSHIWDAKSGDSVPLVRAGEYELRNASFSRDGKIFVGWLPDSDMAVWNTRTGELIDTHPGYNHSRILISDDSRHVFATIGDGMLVEWILSADGASLEDKRMTQVEGLDDIFAEVSGVSRDGSSVYLAVGAAGDSADGAGGWAAVGDGVVSVNLNEFASWVEETRFSPAADFFLTVHGDLTLRMTRVEDGEREVPIGTLSIGDRSDFVLADLLFIDAWRFVTVTKAGSVRLWDANAIAPHTKAAAGVFTPKAAASSEETKAAEQLEAAVSRLQGDPDYQDWRVNKAAISPDGSRAAGLIENIAGGYTDIVVASTRTFDTFGSSIGGEYDLGELAFSPDGRELYARGHDDEVWALPKWIVGPGDRARAGMPALAEDICDPASGRLGGQLRLITQGDVKAAPVLLGAGWRAGDDVCSPPSAWVKFMRWLESPLGGF